MSTEKLTWYVARSGGIVAWVLLALGLILGLLLSSRVLGRRASPAWMLSIHRYLGGLSVIFTVVHVAAIMLDDFVAFGWTDVLIPWASEWNPGAVAWGIIATYLAIAIELTSFAMRRLPKALWRGVHWLSAPLFVMATVHGYQAGTDAGRSFIIAITAVSLVLAVLTVVRVVRSRASSGPRTDPRELLEQAKARRRLAGALPAHAAEPGGVPAWSLADDLESVPIETVPLHAWTDLDTDDSTPVAASWQGSPGAVVGSSGEAETDGQPFWLPADGSETAPAVAPEPSVSPAPAGDPLFEPDLAPVEPRPTVEPDTAPLFESGSAFGGVSGSAVDADSVGVGESGPVFEPDAVRRVESGSAFGGVSGSAVDADSVGVGESGPVFEPDAVRRVESGSAFGGVSGSAVDADSVGVGESGPVFEPDAAPLFESGSEPAFGVDPSFDHEPERVVDAEPVFGVEPVLEPGSVPVVGAEPLRPGESVPAFEPEPLVEPEPAFGVDPSFDHEPERVVDAEPVFGVEPVLGLVPCRWSGPSRCRANPPV